MEIAAVLSAAVAVAVGAAGAVVSGFLGRSERRELVVRRQVEDEELRKALASILVNVPIDKLLVSSPWQSVGNVVEPVAPAVAKEQIKTEVEALMASLKERLRRIEQRFPAEATLEKVASVNDAIMATKLENLEASINRLQDQQLSRWDVALVVFAMLGGFGTLIGILVAVLKLTGH
jgi:membrane protein YqaA with SNARE-associated domain